MRYAPLVVMKALSKQEEKKCKKSLLMFLGIVMLLSSSFQALLSSKEVYAEEQIEMWVQFSEESAEGQVMVNSIKEFNEQNKGKYQATVNYVPRSGSGGGYEDVLNAALTTDSLPDVFTLDGPNTAAYAASGMLQSLDGKISNFDDVLPSIVEQGTVDGKFYAMGYSESGVGIYYNKKMLEEAGVDLSTLPTVDNPWDWNQFNELLATLHDHYKKPVLNMGFDDHSEWLLYAFTPFVWSSGGDLTDAEGKTATGYLDSKESVEAFEFIQSLVKNEYSTITPVEYGFHIEEYPLYMSGSWTMQQLDSEYKDVEYSIMPYPASPTSKESVSPTGSWAYGMSATTEKGEAAATLIDFLSSEEQLYNMSMGNFVLPSRRSVADKMLEEVSEPMKLLIEQNTKTGKARPVLKNYPQVSRTFQETVTEATYFEENPDIQELLKRKAEEMNQYLGQ